MAEIDMEQFFEQLKDKDNKNAYRALQTLQKISENTNAVYAYMDRLGDMLEGALKCCQ